MTQTKNKQWQTPAQKQLLIEHNEKIIQESYQKKVNDVKSRS